MLGVVILDQKGRTLHDMVWRRCSTWATIPIQSCGHLWPGAFAGAPPRPCKPPDQLHGRSALNASRLRGTHAPVADPPPCFLSCARYCLPDVAVSASGVQWFDSI